MTQLIKTKAGDCIIVDDCDFERLCKFPWYVNVRNGKNVSVARSYWNNGRMDTEYITRAIMGFKPGMYIDHIDRNVLNNVRSNLRFCNNSENLMNRGKTRSNKSGYKGVYRQKNSWVAQIEVNWKKIYLGFYKTKEEAALAYNNAAIKYHKEFAVLNIL